MDTKIKNLYCSWRPKKQ